MDHPVKDPIKIVSDNKENYFEQEIVPINIAKTGEKEKDISER
ncbi:hypothetical protein AAEU33_21400 [Chryseobacterium sp. Chry.R1]